MPHIPERKFRVVEWTHEGKTWYRVQRWSDCEWVHYAKGTKEYCIEIATARNVPPPPPPTMKVIYD